MRIAIVWDIHGNRTAFEAVLADLRQTSPDLILHGGDSIPKPSGWTGTRDSIGDEFYRSILFRRGRRYRMVSVGPWPLGGSFTITSP